MIRRRAGRTHRHRPDAGGAARAADRPRASRPPLRLAARDGPARRRCRLADRGGRRSPIAAAPGRSKVTGTLRGTRAHDRRHDAGRCDERDRPRRRHADRDREGAPAGAREDAVDPRGRPRRRRRVSPPPRSPTPSGPIAEAPAARRVLGDRRRDPGAPGSPASTAAASRSSRQRGGGLGERLAGAFADSSATPALLVGMDTPQITPSLLEASVAALCARRAPTPSSARPRTAAGGPSAFVSRNPAVFTGVPMSAGDTADRQRARLAELGLRVRELEQLRDIDTDRGRPRGRRGEPVDADGRGTPRTAAG